MATCWACGAPSSEEIPWCVRCHAPARRPLAARERQLEPPHGFERITPEEAGRATSPVSSLVRPVRSRWLAGPTSFGIWGRLTLTAVVLLFFPWGPLTPMTLFWSLGYIPIAGLILWHVWRKDVAYVSVEPVEHRLPEPHLASRLRTGSFLIGVGLVAVALAGGAPSPLPFLPAIPFLLTVASKNAWEQIAIAVPRLEDRPLVPLIVVNVLNVVDSLASDASIAAGNARELNPLVASFGTGPKIAVVAACSLLLFRRRPQALVWPTLVFVGLAAYHLTGYFLTI